MDAASRSYLGMVVVMVVVMMMRELHAVACCHEL
jgi:hypothetical protein